MLIRFLSLLTIFFLFSCNGIDKNYTNRIDFERTFKGQYEGQPIEIKMLHIDSKISGELILENSKLELEGELNERGRFEVKVLDPLSGQNGIIKGKLKEGDVFKATWTELAGNDEHDLVLNLSEAATPLNFNEIYKRTVEWNRQINGRDYQLIANSYHDTIVFYTELRPKEYCIKLKMKYIDKYPDYRQSIDKTIIVTEFLSGIIKAEFNKTLIRNNEERTYPSYLLFKKIGNELKIVEEGDLLTNTNLNKTLDLGESKRTQTLHNYTEKEIKPESNAGTYFVLFSLILIAIGLLFYYYFYRRKKKSQHQKTEEKKDNHVVVEKVVVEKEVIVEKEVVIEVSSDRNLSESEIKGLEFEKFIVKLFPTKYYELLEWTSDKKAGSIYAKSNENPDLIFATKEKNHIGVFEYSKTNNNVFAVECKFRASLYNDRVELCTDQQVFRYQNFGTDNNMDVFIVLGLGGMSYEPQTLFVIPVQKLQRGYLFVNELQTFERYASTQTNFMYFPTKNKLS